LPVTHVTGKITAIVSDLHLCRSMVSGEREDRSLRVLKLAA
jgi:hypothetical protein